MHRQHGLLVVRVHGRHEIEILDRKWGQGEFPAQYQTNPSSMIVRENDSDPFPPALYLSRDWLPASGEVMCDYPIYCRRFFLDEPELGTAAELHLPLKCGSGRAAGAGRKNGVRDNFSPCGLVDCAASFMFQVHR